MANRQYRIIKPRNLLPPTLQKVLTFSNAAFSRDFVQQDKAIVLDITLIITGNGNVILDGSDPFTTTGTLQLTNLDLNTFQISGQTSGYAIIQYLEIPELIKLEAVKN